MGLGLPRQFVLLVNHGLSNQLLVVLVIVVNSAIFPHLVLCFDSGEHCPLVGFSFFALLSFGCLKLSDLNVCHLLEWSELAFVLCLFLLQVRAGLLKETLLLFLLALEWMQVLIVTILNGSFLVCELFDLDPSLSMKLSTIPSGLFLLSLMLSISGGSFFLKLLLA